VENESTNHEIPLKRVSENESRLEVRFLSIFVDLGGPNASPKASQKPQKTLFFQKIDKN
jgi:hypothetical protein